MKKLFRKLSSEDFDKQFDKGEDMVEYLDTKKARVVSKHQRINVDLPPALLGELDKEAKKIGVARTALIKVWLAEKLGFA